MTSKTLGARAAAMIAAPLAVVALTVSAIVAPAPAEARNLGEEANFIMTRNYHEFIDYKLHAHKPYSFDFSSDGCSSTPAGLREMFDAPCQQHDFGYRNYGRGLMLGRNEDTRRWIDDRLHTEMHRLCDDRFRGFAQQGNNTVCKYQSDSIYSAVRNFGAGAFYG